MASRVGEVIKGLSLLGVEVERSSDFVAGADLGMSVLISFKKESKSSLVFGYNKQNCVRKLFLVYVI